MRRPESGVFPWMPPPERFAPPIDFTLAIPCLQEKGSVSMTRNAKSPEGEPGVPKIVDARHLRREIQEVAFRKGLIPYIPGETPTVVKDTDEGGLHS